MKLSKNIISKVLISAVAMSAGATFTSCDDLLDTKPQGVFTEEQIGEDEATDIMVAARYTAVPLFRQ